MARSLRTCSLAALRGHHFGSDSLTLPPSDCVARGRSFELACASADERRNSPDRTVQEAHRHGPASSSSHAAWGRRRVQHRPLLQFHQEAARIHVRLQRHRFAGYRSILGPISGCSATDGMTVSVGRGMALVGIRHGVLNLQCRLATIRVNSFLRR